MEKRGGGSVITLSFLGSDRVFPNYNVMGVAKAALESTVRYLAADVGAKNVRVNAVSAGPIKTLAAAGIKGFSSILHVYPERAPLRRNVDASEVAEAAAFLLSDAARGVTGEVLMVDAGLPRSRLVAGQGKGQKAKGKRRAGLEPGAWSRSPYGIQIILIRPRRHAGPRPGEQAAKGALGNQGESALVSSHTRGVIARCNRKANAAQRSNRASHRATSWQSRY